MRATRAGLKIGDPSRTRPPVGLAEAVPSHWCTVVPYEYMSVGDVVNGLIYLILSSPTCVDAVWRVRCGRFAFKEGKKLLLRPLPSIFLWAPGPSVKF